jgi:hypothetical protein
VVVTMLQHLYGMGYLPPVSSDGEDFLAAHVAVYLIAVKYELPSLQNPAAHCIQQILGHVR